MYSVELYSRVRRACHVGGMSERAAAGHFGIDRKTVSKILKHSVPPGTAGSTRRCVQSLTRSFRSSSRYSRRTPGSRSNGNSEAYIERLRDEHGFTGGTRL